MEPTNCRSELKSHNPFTGSLLLLLFVNLLFFHSTLQAKDQAKLDCLVKPEMYVELSSPVDTVIEKMLVKTGEHIKKGQPLVQLESSAETVRVKLAALQATSDIEIHNRQVQLKYAKRNKKRVQDLYAKHSVSLFDKEKAVTEADLAEIELTEAYEKKSIAQMNLDLAKAELSIRTLRSPINGIVVDRYLTVGETVTERSIMKLAQIDPLRVELIAPTEYYGLIRKGMPVDIYPERPANKVYKATVSVVDELIDPASGSFTVRMALPNSSHDMVAGVNCIAVFDFPTPSLSTEDLYNKMR